MIYILKDVGEYPAFRQVLVAFGPIFITGVIGMTEGYSSIILPQLQMENSTIQVDMQTSSLIASMSALPMATGCIFGGYLMEKIGRRNMHFLACAPIVIGSFMIAAAQTTTSILIGRFLTGIGDGLLGPATGVYIAETSHPKMRGILINATCVAITVGLFLVHLLGTYLTWRLTSLICGILLIPVLILMIFVPESPTYLVKIKRVEEAKRAFYWCRGISEESTGELEELIRRQGELNNAPKISIVQHSRNLSKPEFWKPAVIISVLFTTSQMTGCNAIASYSIKIIRECGLNEDSFNEYTAMIMMDSCRMIASITSCILVNKMTRRSLTMLSGYGVTVIICFLCAYLYISSWKGFSSTTILLVCLVAYVSFIAIGLTPLSWTMMGEVFPLAHRGLGTGISSFVCYLILYAVVQTFPYLLVFFGNITGVLIFYGLSTLFGTIFLTFFLPETKK